MAQVTNAELKVALDNLACEVGILSRMIRGSNGDRGLVTGVSVLSEKVDMLNKKVDALEVKVTNDLFHKIDENKNAEVKKDAIKFASWEWFTEKGAMPIMIALIVSFLTWFLTSILPDILVHLQQ